MSGHIIFNLLLFLEQDFNLSQPTEYMSEPCGLTTEPRLRHDFATSLITAVYHKPH